MWMVSKPIAFLFLVVSCSNYEPTSHEHVSFGVFHGFEGLGWFQRAPGPYMDSCGNTMGWINKTEPLKPPVSTFDNFNLPEVTHKISRSPLIICATILQD